MNTALLVSAPPAVQIHVAAVCAAIVGVVVVVATRKGTWMHKTFGRVFAVGMTGAAVSSFWITDLNDGSLSVVHLIAAATLAGLVLAIHAIRQGNIARHRTVMTWTAVGGLGVSGVLAVMSPGRLMWQVLFG